MKKYWLIAIAVTLMGCDEANYDYSCKLDQDCTSGKCENGRCAEDNTTTPTEPSKVCESKDYVLVCNGNKIDLKCGDKPIDDEIIDCGENTTCYDNDGKENARCIESRPTTDCPDDDYIFECSDENRIAMKCGETGEPIEIATCEGKCNVSDNKARCVNTETPAPSCRKCQLSCEDNALMEKCEEGGGAILLKACDKKCNVDR
jgi:hypothetical protein